MENRIKETNEYRKIMGVLDEYWVEDDAEFYPVEVVVNIKVLNKNLEYVDKTIRWIDDLEAEEWEDLEMEAIGIGMETDAEKLESLFSNTVKVSDAKTRKIGDSFVLIKDIKRRIGDKRQQLRDEFKCADNERKKEILKESLALSKAAEQYDL